ncbi:TIM-barrel domain-containing protein [Lacinutrix undariae]
MKGFKLLVAAFFLTVYAFAQNSDRIFKNIEDKNTYFQVNVNDGKYLISRYDAKTIETTFIPTGETENTNSHAVIKTSNIEYSLLKEDNNTAKIITDGITVSITKKPFQIAYYYKNELIISEKEGYSKDDSGENIQFNITPDEVLYGGGARALGMNRRGYKLQLYNKAHYGYETHSELMNFTLPIVMSSKKYMVHFDNAPIGYLDLDSKKDNTLTYQTISGRKTYQIIVGDSWLDIVDNYTNLTGKQPMLPRWVLGNFSSRFGYHSQKETLATIQKFKADSIPVDAIILDLYWFGKTVKGTMGNLAFDKDSFPNPKQMIKELRNDNVETILITEPFVLTTSKRWDEAVQKQVLAKDSIGNLFTYDFYFGNTGLIDIYSDTGNTWFKKIYKNLSQLGVTGFWGDLGEPEVHPSKLIHATGTANEVHNIYGHDWAKLVMEANQDSNPNKRPFILMRAGYSGSQRYGLVPWSGDVNRTWGGLQSQPEIALQMGMQGLGYMHSDLGGFAGANLDDELYARWLQYGVFQPIYRPHAQEDVASEPVFRSDKAKGLAKKAIELRYKLLPYNYNLVFQNNQTGAPLMRPLFFEDNTAEFQTVSSTYFWGNQFLITPILEAGITAQTVCFPKGSNWFDFYTDEKIVGGQTKQVATTKSTIPTFVRGGAFIPLAKKMQSTKAYSGNVLNMHYYFDDTVAKSNYELYNDDGLLANAFEKRAFEILKFNAESKKKKLNFNFNAEVGQNYSTSKKQINLVIHNIKNYPKRIKVNGEKVDVIWNQTRQTITIPMIWNISEDLKIQIKLKQ